MVPFAGYELPVQVFKFELLFSDVSFTVSNKYCHNTAISTKN